MAAMIVAAIRKQVERGSSRSDGFLSAPGRSRAAKLPRGFDVWQRNWLGNVLGSSQVRREAHEGARNSNAFEYKAEHKARVMGKWITRASVQNEECL
jgi:hypothetical protein